MDEASDGGNFHSPRLAVYRRMLDAFQPIWNDIVNTHRRGADRYRLTVDEFAAVIKARIVHRP